MKNKIEISFAVLESSSNQIFIGQISDDLRYSNFKKFLVEV